jgi:NADH:ubiquinone oxidoreductase subunit F (NADH-binding)
VSALAAEVPFAPRLLAGLRGDRPITLAEHLARHGALDEPRLSSLPELIEASGLRGRGGGAFPVARKIAAVAAQRAHPVVVVNACEGEPLSGKDKVLLRHVPHLVLDGAVALASAVGARDVVVAVAVSARPERAVLEAALAERRPRRLDVRVTAVPDRFVTGEETALLQFLNGGSALPTLTPPLPFERGVAGRPTLVQNVETAACVALIARHGPAWFRRVGTPADPGSALFTLSGAVVRPGVHEAPLGILLTELIDLVGGTTSTPGAVLVGGYFGTWFTAADARSLTLDDACLAPRGGALGARAIAVLPSDACGVSETARVAGYLAGESAAQCGSCVNGLAAIAAALEQMARLAGGDQRAHIARWCRMVNGRGACRHPDGAVRFVGSALEVFADEFAAHAVRGHCRHGDARVLPVPTRAR